MTPLPKPHRIRRGRDHWFVWFAVPDGQGRRFKLAMFQAEPGSIQLADLLRQHGGWR